VFAGVTPFLAIDLLTLLLLIFIPELTLFLPSLMQ
jgi:TRAP-type C4-dicarboxylate transport system permease large subunit